MSPPMRLGILGGSFDPIHYGHLLLAENCRQQCRLDRVWLLPAAAPPHKLKGLVATAAHRVAMIERAVDDHPVLEVSKMELERGGVSYTVDTLKAIDSQFPTAELFLLVGADSLTDVPNWRNPQEICRLATIAVARRPDAPEPDLQGLARILSPDLVDAICSRVVAMPRIALSSSEIRHRVASGQSIRYLTPDSVVRYIEEQGLYGPV